MFQDKNYLEILKIARDLVINEHTDRRAELHNKWLVDSERLWRTSKLKLPYPPIPPYPTESDIVKRAKTLIEFVDSQNSTVEINTTSEESSNVNVHVESGEITSNIKSNTEPTASDTASSEVSFNEVPEEQTPRPLFDVSKNLEQAAEVALERTKMKLLHDIETDSAPTVKAIPSLIQRLEELRSKWR
jgi:hypothetical protein